MTKKIRKGPVAGVIISILLIITLLIIKSSGGDIVQVNNTMNTTPHLSQNLTQQAPPKENSTKTQQKVEYIKPVSVQLTMPVNSDYTYILNVGDINKSFITVKYDASLIDVTYDYYNGKLIIYFHPKKNIENAVIFYYKGKKFAFFDIKPIEVGLIKVSKSIVENYRPFTKIDKTYTFTVENPFNYEKHITVLYAVKGEGFDVSVDPVSLTLKPGESKNITVHVSGFLNETPVTIILTIDGVERYITLNTNPLLMNVKLLNNYVVAGSQNKLELEVSINYPMDFYLYVNGEYYKEVNLKKGDNIITIYYTLPKPSEGTCYLKYISQYGTLTVELKNPWVDKKYTFTLNVEVHYPIEFKVFKTVLSFEKYESDNTLIIIKNNNNYTVTLTPHFYICNTVNDIENNNCQNATKEFNINFYEVGGEEFNKVTLKPFQQKIYRLVVSPKVDYYISYKKYLLITFNETMYINGKQVTTKLDRGVVVELVNHVNQTRLIFEPDYTYSKTKGGILHIKIIPETDKTLVNVTITYWLKAYNGDAFVMVRPPITLNLSEIKGEYNLYVSLPKGNDFFIFYIEGKGVNIYGSSLIYIYPTD